MKFKIDNPTDLTKGDIFDWKPPVANNSETQTEIGDMVAAIELKIGDKDDTFSMTDLAKLITEKNNSIDGTPIFFDTLKIYINELEKLADKLFGNAKYLANFRLNGENDPELPFIIRQFMNATDHSQWLALFRQIATEIKEAARDKNQDQELWLRQYCEALKAAFLKKTLLNFEPTEVEATLPVVKGTGQFEKMPVNPESFAKFLVDNIKNGLISAAEVKDYIYEFAHMSEDSDVVSLYLKSLVEAYENNFGPLEQEKSETEDDKPTKTFFNVRVKTNFFTMMVIMVIIIIAIVSIAGTVSSTVTRNRQENYIVSSFNLDKTAAKQLSKLSDAQIIDLVWMLALDNSAKSANEIFKQYGIDVKMETPRSQNENINKILGYLE